MNVEQAYSILYTMDGKCHQSPEILEILQNVIMSCKQGTVRDDINNVSRWNIYLPSSIHIVYTTISHGWSGGEMKGEQLICQISDFEKEYKKYHREKQLNELGI